MYEIKEVGPFAGSACQLIITDEKTALIDTGFGFCAEKTIENIKNALCGRKLDIIILTHSHYDHAGGCCAVKNAFPEAEVYAGEYAAKIFAKESARKVMNEMDASAAKLYGEQPVSGCFDNISIDKAVKDGDIISLGNDKLTVWETPGHTRCSVALADIKNKVFFSSETLGVYIGEGVILPCYLVEYSGTIRSIERAIDADFEYIQIPHGELLYGKRAKRFLDLCLTFNKNAHDIIIEKAQSGLDEKEIFDWYKAVFYNPACAANMPQSAFDMNAGYTIKCTLKELENEN